MTPTTKARAFAAYIGSEVQGQPYNTSDTIRDHGPEIAAAYVSGILLYVTSDSCVVQYGSKSGEPWPELTHVPFDQCKLLLTPLDQITDEDAVEVARIFKIGETPIIFERDSERVIVEGDNGMQVWVWFDGDFLVENSYREETQALTTPSAVYDFLRSRFYLLPFAGVDLIEAGIARVKNKEGHNE